MKKVIIREALILLGFLCLSALCFIGLLNFEVFGDVGESVLAPLFVSVGLYSYPIFMLIRFILWLRKRRDLR